MHHRHSVPADDAFYAAFDFANVIQIFIQAIAITGAQVLLNAGDIVTDPKKLARAKRAREKGLARLTALYQACACEWPLDRWRELCAWLRFVRRRSPSW